VASILPSLRQGRCRDGRRARRGSVRVDGDRAWPSQLQRREMPSCEPGQVRVPGLKGDAIDEGSAWAKLFGCRLGGRTFQGRGWYLFAMMGSK